jgi:hypothetical protein
MELEFKHTALADLHIDIPEALLTLSKLLAIGYVSTVSDVLSLDNLSRKLTELSSTQIKLC